jgi:thiol-disulfide isomerase/thioredoxin
VIDIDVCVSTGLASRFFAHTHTTASESQCLISSALSTKDYVAEMLYDHRIITVGMGIPLARDGRVRRTRSKNVFGKCATRPVHTRTHREECDHLHQLSPRVRSRLIRIAVAICLGLWSLTGTATPADIPNGLARRSPAPLASTPKQPSIPNQLMRTAIPLDGKTFGEGWRQTIRLKAVPGDAYDVWVKDGWLNVKRYNDSKGLDWQILLAHVSGSDPPRISTIEGAPLFELSYGDGRYFIRETFHSLRSLRERKRAEQCLPRPTFLDKRFEPTGRCVATVPTQILSSWQDEEWVFAACGPNDQRFDAVIRLNPAAKESPGHGFQSFVGGLAYFFHGNTWIMDDGELLVASRTLESAHRMELARTRVRENLSGAAPPAIRASAWINCQRPLAWDRLKGKVVLIDFWGAWCQPCVKKLPDLQQLANKYGSRGLVVIGIHSTEGRDLCKEFVIKHHISFPIAIDTGATATEFAITNWPTLFLIDKTGKVVTGYTSDLPTDDVVDALLTR